MQKRSFFYNLSPIKIVLFLILSAFALSLLQLNIDTGLRLIRSQSRAMDFQPFYVGAKMITKSAGSKFYDLPTQSYWTTQSLTQTQKAQKDFQPFFNPPFTAFLLSPLATLSMTDAYALQLYSNCTGIFTRYST